MNRHKANTALSTSDLLQIDVMRFLAIIAFCLIAISTLLVPQIAQQPDVHEETAAVQAPAKPAANTPEKIPEKTQENAQEKTQNIPETIARTGLTETTPPTNQVMAYTVAPETTAPLELSAPTSPDAPIPTQRTAAEPETAAAQPAATAEAGLSLKFVNDAAFLTLLSQQRISLWAQDPEQKTIWSIDERFNFHEVAQVPQHAFHQLFPDTLPGIVHQAFFDDANQWTWGITLPEPMEKRLQTMAQQYTQGALVIDRRGNIHYRPDSASVANNP